MAEIVNLNQYRKSRQRTEKRRRAAENRVLHGRTKAQRKSDEGERDGTARALDMKRLDQADDDEKV